MGRSFVAYFRVSTERQGQSGLGLEAQGSAVQAFLNPQDQVLAEYVEVESGRNTDRPELAAALANARRQGATLLIAKLDRLARKVSFIATLLDAGVDLEAVDMPGANRFVLHVMAAVAEQEARVCSERTKAALAAARGRGAKLGWSNPKRIAEHRAASAKGVATNKQQTDAFTDGLGPAVRAFLAQSADASPTQLAAYLNAQRIPARRGGLWHASSARNLLRRMLAKPDFHQKTEGDSVYSPRNTA